MALDAPPVEDPPTGRAVYLLVQVLGRVGRPLREAIQ
jgi:hypothetical protein